MERLLELVRQAAEAAAVGPTGSFADVPAAVRDAWAAMVRTLSMRGVPVSAIDRDAMGRLVRDVMRAHARVNPIICGNCAGKREVHPSCPYCGDSTFDHECPPPVTCAQCDGTGVHVQPAWLIAWDNLPEADREMARRIGETLAVYALALMVSLPLRMGKESWFQMKALMDRLQELKPR